MAVFNVKGAYLASGRDTTLRLSAVSEQAAREQASAMGVISETVERDPWSDATPPPLPHPVQPVTIDPAAAFASGVCGAVALLLYISAGFGWIALLSALGVKEGVTAFPIGHLAIALGLTASAALLHAASIALRLLGRIAHRA